MPSRAFSIDEQLRVLRRCQDDYSARAETAETSSRAEEFEYRADVLEAIARDIELGKQANR